ncbi:hypothetical protein [Phyllobacterium endophyticum]|uniref:thiolase family protein n=1 Tax=Phyllobacterium endophyticum TaxID=1149773 RepID=UPI0011C9D0F3|nr:hypothetical protein [Phyllobacterium endophyticum]TXR50554.1 hypothetical protein FVA77_04640 [Phyllobacterium endophyticum]
MAELAGITPERQDESAVLNRAHGAQLQIILVVVSQAVKNPSDGTVTYRTVIVRSDKGPRESNIDVLRSLKPILLDGSHITAGNASQLSDGASALMLMDASFAGKKMGA